MKTIQDPDGVPRPDVVQSSDAHRAGRQDQRQDNQLVMSADVSFEMVRPPLNCPEQAKAGEEKPNHLDKQFRESNGIQN